MKKSILLASGLAFTAAFVGCDDGSAKNAELQAQLDQAKQERDAQSLANQEELNNLATTYQYRVDSLQYVIDSLTAPKGTTPSKPKPSKPATTTTTETPKKEDDGKLDVKGSEGKKLDVKGTDEEGTEKSGGKLKVKP